MDGTYLRTARCDCGGRLVWGTEQTGRGPRWYFACECCGTWWRHNDGVLGPVGREPVGNSALSPAELRLLACFRRLPGEVQSEVASRVQALALSTPVPPEPPP